MGTQDAQPRAGVMVTDHLEFTLPRTREAPGTARQRLARWLNSQLDESELHRAMLLTSELVTNAVMHGQGEITLRAFFDNDRVLVEVIDQGQGFERVLREQHFERIGGHGLDTDSFEALRASYRGKFLGKAVAYDNRQKEIPARFIQSLRWHPVRLISFVGRPYYYGAKKKYLDWVASRHLQSGRYDFFHSWSGDCLESLRVAKQKKIPSLIEIPTWHRGSQKSALSSQKSEIEDIQ